MVEVALAKVQEVGAPEVARVNPEVAAKTQVAGAPEAPTLTAVEELGAGSHTPAPAPAAGAPAEVTPAATLRRWSHLDWSHLEVTPEVAVPFHPEVSPEVAFPETEEAVVVPATPIRAFRETPCPPSSGKRGPSPSRSSPSPGSSGGRPPPQIDADGFQLVVGRTGGRGRRGAEGRSPRKRGRGRGMRVCDFCDDYNYGIKHQAR